MMVIPAQPSTDAPTLAALQQQYPEYSIRRTPRLWIATRRDDDPRYAPTVTEEDRDAFVRQLRHPPARAGCPYTAAVFGS